MVSICEETMPAAEIPQRGELQHEFQPRDIFALLVVSFE